MNFWTPFQFQSITAGRWLIGPAATKEKTPLIKGFSIDSRTIKPGDAFVAVRGEQHDGHDHVAAAIERGAAMVIVERELRIADCESRIENSLPSSPQSAIRNPQSAPVLLVGDSVRALQQLAAAWRDELGKSNVKVIAVTGSNGKTSTRNMIHAALSSTLRGTQSPKSFNNHLGVPLTLLAAKAEDDFVVAEVGTNHPGEIAALAAILKPHVAVITNIGTAHIGMFGSKDAIAAEKSSLFRFIEKGGCAVMNGTQPWCESWRKDVVPAGAAVATFGQKDGCDVRTEGPTGADERGLRFTLDGGQAVTLPLLGQHNIDNALAAFAVTRAMGIDDGAAATALASSTGVEMRMQIQRLGAGDGAAGITLINDAYNANPDSTVSALSTLASLPVRDATRRVAVLGDMLELGDESEYEHRHIGDMLCVFNQLSPRPAGAPAPSIERAAHRLPKIQLAILVGAQMKFAAQQLARVWPEGTFVHFERWSDDLPAKIASRLEEGDLVLLKASRGLRFERLLPPIEQRVNQSAVCSRR